MIRSIMKLARRAFATRSIDSVLSLLTQKKSLNSVIVKFTPENTDYKRGTFRDVKRNGINFRLDISEYQNWLVYFGIAADDTASLFNLIKKGDVIIDVGANIGQTALYCGMLADSSGQVFAFEPDPDNFRQCEINKSLNMFNNISFFNYGLGEHTGIANMQLGERNRGGNSIVTNYSASGNIININLTSLDSFASEMDLNRISVIKIDVEGYELNVLRGATDVLHKFRPLLYIEIDDSHLKRQSHTPEQVFDFLVEHNYKIHDATGKALDLNERFTGCHFDIIGLPTERIPK